jgi:hypothetical protein
MAGILRGGVHVPRSPGALSGDELVRSISEVRKSAKKFNWRIHDLTIMPVERDMLEQSGSIKPGSADQDS